MSNNLNQEIVFENAGFIKKSHDNMMAGWMKEPAFKSEYDALEDDFALFDELIKARNKAGLTQEKVAQRMGTKIPAISRIESGGGEKKHSPTIATLRRYAEACGYRLKIRLIPFQSTRRDGRDR